MRWASWVIALALGCEAQVERGADSGGDGGAAGGTAAGEGASGGTAQTGGDAAAGGAAAGGAAAVGGGTAAGGAPGTGGDSAGGAPGGTGVCSVAHHVEIPLNLFGVGTVKPTVARVGERFAVVQSEYPRRQALALVSWQGVEAKLVCTDDCPQGIGVGLTPEAGEPQMLLVGGEGAVAWEGDQRLVGPTLLSAPGYVPNPRTATHQLKASKDGRRALFAFGNAAFDPTVHFFELAEDATIVRGAQTMNLEGWVCLAVVPTKEAGVISIMSEDAWFLRELDAAGNVVTEASVTVPLGASHQFGLCPDVIEGPSGYHAHLEGLLVTAGRASSEAPPSVIELSGSPGTLVGVLNDELVFESRRDGRTRFATLDASGAPARDLFALPVASPRTSFVDIEGNSLFVTYETESARVIEEIACPE